VRVSLKFGCCNLQLLLSFHLQLWGPVSRMSSIWSLCCKVLVEIALLESFLYKSGTKVTCHGLDVVKHRQSRTVVPSHILYNLESNPHPFYSFRGPKNQMRIRIVCRLDLRSWAGFWKNDKGAIRTIQYNNLLFIICYTIFIIYYSSDSPSSLITESLSVTQSLSSLSSTSSSRRMSSLDPSKALLMQHFLKDLTIMLSGMAFHAANTHRMTSEGG